MGCNSMRSGIPLPSRPVISPNELPARSRSICDEYIHSAMPTCSPPGLMRICGVNVFCTSTPPTIRYTPTGMVEIRSARTPSAAHTAQWRIAESVVTTGSVGRRNGRGGIRSWTLEIPHMARCVPRPRWASLIRSSRPTSRSRLPADLHCDREPRHTQEQPPRQPADHETHRREEGEQDPPGADPTAWAVISSTGMRSASVVTYGAS